MDRRSQLLVLLKSTDTEEFSIDSLSLLLEKRSEFRHGRSKSPGQELNESICPLSWLSKLLAIAGRGGAGHWVEQEGCPSVRGENADVLLLAAGMAVSISEGSPHASPGA